LIVTGATADGEFFIVKGVPNSIRGFMNGKPITILRGLAPTYRPTAPDSKTVSAELKRLTDELAALSAKAPSSSVAAKTAAPAPMRASASPAATSARLAEKGAPAPTGTTSPALAPSSAKPQYITAKDVRVYQVTPNDPNLRTVIDNWAKVVGWNFLWDVDRDIPINGGDAKENDFKSAVRRVLASTEFGDLPVKPCFYSNDFIRVVPKTTKCNPNE
jgi:hypothetical protein